LRYLAIDLGSTFTKTAILDTERMSYTNESSVSAPGSLFQSETRYEIDADKYFHHVKSIIDTQLLQFTGIQGILFSTQMHGFVLTARNGLPETSVISWRDRASLEMASDRKTWLEVLSDLLRDYHELHTGVPLKNNLPLSNLFPRVKSGEINLDGRLFHTLGGMIIYRLCGRHVCHITNAAPSGMVNLLTGKWHSAVIERAGFSSMEFPEIFSSLDACGTYRLCGREYAVYPDIGDHQACVIGSRSLPQKDLNVNIGTAGLIGVIVDDYVPGSYENRPYFGGRFLRTVSGLAGGYHLERMAKVIQKNIYGISCDRIVPEVWKQMTSVSPCSKKIPLDLDSWLAAIERKDEMGTGCQPEEWIDALYREIAVQYHQAACRLGIRIERLVYSGGCILKNPALRHRLEVQMEHPGAILTPDHNAALTGLLMLAAERDRSQE